MNSSKKNLEDSFDTVPKYKKAILQSSTTQKIPRNIVQTHETNFLPKRMVKHIYTWINLNPTYDYYFFDDNDRINFIKEHFESWVLEMYNDVIAGAMKADIFRLCFLYIKGGIYSDIDQTCLNSLDSVIDPEDDFVTGVCRNTPHQSLIISSPNNPLFLHALEQGYKRIKQNRPLKGNWGYVGGYLGPAAYTFSWQWFHQNKVEPNIGNNDDWLFKYPFRKGKYTLDGFNFNVKNHSLVGSHIVKNEKGIKICTIKYKGYDEDTKKLGIIHYKHMNKNLIKKRST